MFYVLEDRETDKVRISDSEDMTGSEIEIHEAESKEEAEAFASRYQQNRITSLIENLGEMGKAPSFYFVTTMFIEKEKHDHVVKHGFFATKELATSYLLDNWPSLHEYWNNYGVVEKVQLGLTHNSCWEVEQWWYKDETAEESKLSEKLIPTDRPKCTEINEGMATMFAF